MPRLLVALLLATNLLAAGRDLAPRPYGPSAYTAQGPLVAHAGGKYLTVWLESLGNAGWRHLGVFSDSAGKPLSPAFVLIPYGIAGPAHLIGTGDRFSLFFPDDAGVQMLDVDLAGRVTATRIVPVEGFRYHPAVTWNGSHFVALGRTGNRSRAVFFDRTGAIARTVDLPCPYTLAKLLAVRTDALVARVCDGGELRLDRIAQDGLVTTTTLETSYTRPQIPVVAAPAAGGDTLIAWSSPEQDESLKTLLLSASATRSVLQGGKPIPLIPLTLVPSPDGFLLPYTKYGNLRVATLNADGSLRNAAEEAEPSPGFNVSAATDGTTVLVADNPYVPLPGPGLVRTQLVTGNAEVKAPEEISIVPARQLQPILGAGSGTLVAAWTEVMGTTGTVKAARVSADGTPMASAAIAENASLVASELAWNGADYLTVIIQDGKLRAQRITAFGEPAPGTPAFLGDARLTGVASAAVVWADDRWIVGWTYLEDAFLAEVDSNGLVTAQRPLRLEGIVDEGMYRTGIVQGIALAWDGSTSLVGWTEDQSVYDCRITCLPFRPAFVSAIPSGETVAGPPTRVGQAEEFVRSMALAAQGQTLVAVANYDYGYKAARTVAFERTGDALKPVASRDFQGLGDVTWDGSAFVLALRERDELTIRRLDTTLRDAGHARVVRLAQADVDSVPTIAAAFSGNAIAGVQECDAGGGRAVVYAERELDLAPLRRRSIRR